MTFGFFSFAGAITGAFTAQWSVLKVGAGGQITAVYNYPDGTTICRGDEFGGWIYEPNNPVSYGATTYAGPAWRSLITSTSIPSYSIDTNYAEGPVEIVAAPSSTNVLYMLWAFQLWVSTNRGVNWVKCSNFVGTNLAANPNNAISPYIAVDPTDVTGNTLFVDSGGKSGVYRSINGTSGASATFAQVAGLTNSSIHIVAFQPGSSTHVGILEVGTNGIFESTNGTTFSHVTAGSPPPSTLGAPHITCDKFNQFWVWNSSAIGNSNIWRWASSTWSQINTGLVSAGSGSGATAFAADPNSASVGLNRIVAVDYCGQMVISSDNGASWSAQQTNETISVGASQPTWIGNANQNQGSGSYLLNGYSVTFDQSSNLLFAGGLGVWQTNAPVTGSATVWNCNTLGIEMLIDVTIVNPPGGYPMMGVWDKGIFTLSNPDVFPSTYWNNSTSGGNDAIINGFGIDWAAGHPGFVVGYIPSNTNNAAVSTDGGFTWTKWTTSPIWTGQDGGNIAASTDQNWILVPATNAGIFYTLNGGGLWQASTGGPSGIIGKGTSFAIAADRVNTGQFATASGGTFYQSTNNGATFASTPATADGSPGTITLKSVPGKSSVYLYTPGEQSGSAGAHPANTHLWRLTKTSVPCDTATSVNANLKEVISFGFGAIPPGNSSYTVTIYACGWFNGVQGYWQSTDGGTTWAGISVPTNQIPWPINSADFPIDLEGDPDVYGRIYVALQGSGGAYIDTQDAVPWVKFDPSSVKANQSLTGTITLTAKHSGLVPVTGVQFRVDGVNVGSVQTGQSSYSVSWNTGGVATGAHTLSILTSGNGYSNISTQSIPITTH